MTNKSVELQAEAVAKLEAAKWSADETLSSVILRAEFPSRPRTARDLMTIFSARAGHSPLSEEALDRLTRIQEESTMSPSHWE